MGFSRDYIRIVEEIRKDNSMSVSMLCEGIISERTYYRYLKTDKEIPYQPYIRLVDRLNIELGQIMDYIVYFQKSDSSLLRFPYRVHTLNFADVDIHYQKIKEEAITEPPVKLMINAYIKKYEYLIKIINQTTYIESLEGIMEEMNQHKDMGIFLVMVQSLYLEIHPSQKRIDANQVAKRLLALDYRFAIMFYTFSIDNLLEHFMTHKGLDMRLFDQMLEQLTKISTQIPLTHIDMKLHFYIAFQNERQGNVYQMQDHLYKALAILVYFFGGQQYEELSKMAKLAFGISVQTFLVERTPYMMEKRFDIQSL